MKKHMRNVIVCVTDKCNLSCKYCFASCNKRELDYEEINEKFIRAIPDYVCTIKKVCEENEYHKTQVIFHGGEPLLIKSENYEKLISKLTEYDIDYVMQTNGTIMNEEIYEFIIRHGIRLGISLDGPEDIHDASRISKGKGGSHRNVMNTIEYLKSRQYKFSCLATITQNALGKEKEIYDFFVSNKLDFDFNPVFSVMESSGQDYLITQDEYANFVIRIFDLWFDSKDPVMIIKFYNIIKALVDENSPIKKCDCSANCSDFFVAVDNNGYIYNCSRFVGYKNHRLSSVFSNDFSVTEGIPEIENRDSYLNREDCRNCEIWNICHGGCPYNALERNGSIFSKDYFCEGKKQIILHIKEALERYRR